MNMKSVFLVAVMIGAVLARNYPMYKQCDAQWGSLQLGTSTKTICQAGCLMSSAAMALSGTGHSYNPKTLNDWLKGNGGYVSGNLFVWASINKLGLTFKGFVANSAIKSNLDAGNVVICNVHNGGHWVLAHGYSEDNILVNDPGYSTASYSLGEIVNNNNGVYSVSNLPESWNTFYYELKATIYDYLSIEEELETADEPEVERNLLID